MSRSEGLLYMFRGRPGSAFFCTWMDEMFGFYTREPVCQTVQDVKAMSLHMIIIVLGMTDWLIEWISDLCTWSCYSNVLLASESCLLFKFVLFLPLWKWVKDVMTWNSIWTAARYSVNGCIYNGYFCWFAISVVFCVIDQSFIFVLLGQLLICCKLYISFVR